jgi:hypothetical protein
LVEVLCRAAVPADGYTPNDNSLEGLIGSSDMFNAEFEYTVLGTFMPKSIAIGQTGQLDVLYTLHSSRSIPKRRKRVYRSSEQFSDSPSVQKVHMVIGRVGNTANYIYNIAFNGHSEFFITRREKNLFSDTYAT